ncbi:hypothetical protein [Achromobacter ruhlandii]|uniref:hypothetical protein n=1 Tax=Achromobacter ruhlandii TaxID=72557 RepID=UPI003BA31734
MYIGKCSRCGGDVDLPDHWFGVQRARATCTSCHAVSADDFRQVIPMEPSPEEQAKRRQLYQNYIAESDKAREAAWPWLSNNTR